MKYLNWVPAVIYAALIFLLSHQSNPPGAGSAPDYVLHFLEYGFFGLTIVWGLTSGLKNSLDASCFFRAWLFSFVYACLDEFHQLFIPNRFCSLQDLLADWLGAFCFIGVAYLILKGWKERSK